MARAASKTVRFTRIVERSGEPHAHTLWLPPDKDPELKRAVAAHRVMTIEPGASGKTDVGVVGFDPKRTKDAQFLIFPKSLKRFEGARVVGIKFDLVEQPKFAAASELKTALRAAKPKHAKRKHPVQPVPAAVRPKVEEAEEKIVAFEPHRRAPPPSRTPKQKPRPAPKRTRAADTALVREVRAALKELKAGKSAAASHRLERAIEI